MLDQIKFFTEIGSIAESVARDVIRQPGIGHADIRVPARTGCRTARSCCLTHEFYFCFLTAVDVSPDIEMIYSSPILKRPATSSCGCRPAPKKVPSIAPIYQGAALA